jgi:hypothetical protein
MRLPWLPTDYDRTCTECGVVALSARHRDIAGANRHHDAMTLALTASHAGQEWRETC